MLATPLGGRSTVTPLAVVVEINRIVLELSGAPEAPSGSSSNANEAAIAMHSARTLEVLSEEMKLVKCGHTFVPSEGHPYAVFQRALRNGNLWVAEAEARDLRRVPLEDALKLVYLYAEKESPKYERAAMKFLRRYLDEKEPTLKNFAKVVRSLEDRVEDSLPE